MKYRNTNSWPNNGQGALQSHHEPFACMLRTLHSRYRAAFASM